MLVEVNCETDFVARGDKFKELVSDLAMQVGLQHQATEWSASACIMHQQPCSSASSSAPASKSESSQDKSSQIKQ